VRCERSQLWAGPQVMMDGGLGPEGQSRAVLFLLTTRQAGLADDFQRPMASCFFFLLLAFDLFGMARGALHSQLGSSARTGRLGVSFFYEDNDDIGRTSKVLQISSCFFYFCPSSDHVCVVGFCPLSCSPHYTILRMLNTIMRMTKAPKSQQLLQFRNLWRFRKRTLTTRLIFNIPLKVRCLVAVVP